MQREQEILIMGRVTIELPLQVDRHFRITDAKVAATVLQQLESLTQVKAIPSDVAVQNSPQRRKERKEKLTMLGVSFASVAPWR
jgi:hypothetical protein